MLNPVGVRQLLPMETLGVAKFWEFSKLETFHGNKLEICMIAG